MSHHVCLDSSAQVNNEIRVICTSDLHEIFPVETIIYYSIHGIILVVGLVLAFQTRNVTIKAFKESRQTSFAIFVLAMSLLVIAPVSIIVVLPVDIAAGLVSSVSIFLVVAVQCTLFLPKVSANMYVYVMRAYMCGALHHLKRHIIHKCM